MQVHAVMLFMLFGAKQVVYTWFLELFNEHLYVAAENNAMRAVRVIQTVKLPAGRQDNELKTHY